LQDRAPLRVLVREPANKAVSGTPLAGTFRPGE